MCVRGRGDIFGAARLNYKLFTNIAGLVVWASRLGLTITRGGTDPASRMKVNRRRAVRLEQDGATAHFCSEHRKQTHEGAAR